MPPQAPDLEGSGLKTHERYCGLDMDALALLRNSNTDAARVWAWTLSLVRSRPRRLQRATAATAAAAHATAFVLG